jgi:type I restriction enzyme S subunit
MIELWAGGAAQPNLGAKELEKFFIPCPTKAEQTAIATALSDADQYIAHLEKLIAKKRLIKQGAMQELLKPKEGWVVKRLGEIAEIYTGKKNNQDKVEGGNYPFFVRSQNIEKINSYSYDGEAILIPGEGNIGKIFHYINGKFDFHQRVYKISDFEENYSGKYIFKYLSENFGRHALENSVKATVDSLRLPTFQEFEIPFPKTLNEQNSIALILGEIDGEISSLEVQLAKAQSLKQGMMQQLLTGKIRLE